MKKQFQLTENQDENLAQGAMGTNTSFRKDVAHREANSKADGEKCSFDDPSIAIKRGSL